MGNSRFKFRAWDKAHNFMFIGTKLTDLMLDNTFTPNGVFRLEIMQFTGLHDKNGKEVYESDIVRLVYDGKEYVYQVVFDESELDFKATNGKTNYGRNFQYLTSCEEVEVIGNIYENADLLN